MKKNMFKSVAITAVIAFAGTVLTSCGGGASGNSIVQEAINAAEQSIPLEETPMFGTLPSLLKQKLEAGTIMGKQFRELKTEDMDEAIKNKEKRDEAEKEMEEFYSKKLEEVAQSLDGKAIKVEFDTKQISAASTTLKLMKASKGYFNIVFDVTLTQPVNKEIKFVWEYRDAEGNVLETNSDYFVPGDKFNKEFMVIAGNEWAPRFDHLYIKF
jgi:hypothetical protein